MSYKIMIVDDEPANLRALERLFRDTYEVSNCGIGRRSIGVVATTRILLY